MDATLPNGLTFAEALYLALKQLPQVEPVTAGQLWMSDGEIRITSGLHRAPAVAARTLDL